MTAFVFGVIAAPLLAATKLELAFRDLLVAHVDALRARLLVDVGAERRAEVEARAADLAGLLGETRFTVRFPSPLSTSLLSR